MVDSHILAWVNAHGILVIVCYYLLSNAIGALDAPTATSSGFYRWFFKFANGFGANLTRAFSTTIEKSPNWNAALTNAVNKLPGGNGGATTQG